MRVLKRNRVAYLLFGPGQLVLQLLLLVEKSLVLSAQRRETSGELIRKLRDVLLSFVSHSCGSRELQWRCRSKSLGRDQLRLRGKEAALADWSEAKEESADESARVQEARPAKRRLLGERRSPRDFPMSSGGASALRLSFWPWFT